MPTKAGSKASLNLKPVLLNALQIEKSGNWGKFKREKFSRFDDVTCAPTQPSLSNRLGGTRDYVDYPLAVKVGSVGEILKRSGNPHLSITV